MEDFDISTLAAEDTTTVTIKNPQNDLPLTVKKDEATGKVLPSTAADAVQVSVTIYGPGSKPFAEARSVQSSRFMKKVKAKGAGAETTADEDAVNTADFLVPCTVSFNNFSYKGMPQGAEMFRALFLDPKMGWFTEQVNKAMGDWANFTTDAPTS